MDSKSGLTGFDQGRTAAHEGIGHLAAREVIRGKVSVGKRGIPEFGKGQRAKKRSRPSRKPFVHGDDGPVVLLNLLLLERHAGDQGDVESLFDAHVSTRPFMDR